MEHRNQNSQRHKLTSWWPLLSYLFDPPLSGSRNICCWWTCLRAAASQKVTGWPLVQLANGSLPLRKLKQENRKDKKHEVWLIFPNATDETRQEMKHWWPPVLMLQNKINWSSPVGNRRQEERMTWIQRHSPDPCLPSKMICSSFSLLTFWVVAR